VSAKKFTMLILTKNITENPIKKVKYERRRIRRDSN
jgi:hypothetical protein